jgi:hypothetical protein
VDQQSDIKQPISPVPGELYQEPCKLADAATSAIDASALVVPGPIGAPQGEQPATNLPGTLVGAKKGPKDLSRKARAFLELLVAGKSTLEAYELAGYTGEKHAAYQLRSDLRFHLVQMLEAHGVSREDTKIQLMELLKLPVSERTVSVGTKLKLLKFLDKLTEPQREGGAITPFLVNIAEPKSVTINEAKK